MINPKDTIKMADEGMVICKAIKGNESEDFDSTALYRTSNLLKYMGGIFEFIKSFDNKSEDKVKVVLNIAVNINPSSNISRIYEKEN